MRGNVVIWFWLSLAIIPAVALLIMGGLLVDRCEYPDRYGKCGCVYETAQIVLAAVDEADRVAGVVRARADVLAEIREYADEWAAQPNLYSPAHAAGVLAAALDRVAAAGAQPPPKVEDHG
jgi:hypothetical protein